MPPRTTELPISDYGVVGNLRSVALVGRDGSVDWCCFPHLSAPSCFGALLDLERGGHFQVGPASGEPGAQEYLPGTPVLRTHWRDGGGSLSVTDFMPVSGPLDGTVPPAACPELHRLVCCEAGHVEVGVEWAPRLDYGRRPTRIERVPGGYLSRCFSPILTLAGLPPGATLEDAGDGPCVRARVRLREGERLALVTQWEAGPAMRTLHGSEQALRTTVEAWRRWLEAAEACAPREWAGPHRELLTRSELTLKLLTFADSGAIAAAATTSLPETPGGVRNWDYRYVWLRDGGLAAQALLNLGHSHEALRFLEWAEAASDIHSREERRMHVLYGLHGEVDLPEEELTHWRGYRGSRPVRIGNAACGQLQHDIHGELLTSAYELERHGVPLTGLMRGFLAEVADEVCRVWREPDHGLWEIRGGTRHYTYSKLMCWVALDRACKLAERDVLRGDVTRWRVSAESLRAELLREGYSERRGAFVQAYGSEALDAASLLVSVQEFLPPGDARVLGTLDATLAHLTEADMVYRYRCDDGLPGEEGTFGLCTFWLVAALALAGRVDEAERIFEGMARRASPLGLYAEQLDARTGAHLGNFPQAFTHLGLINSLMYLAQARGARVPTPPLIGTEAHRSSRGAPPGP